MLVVRYYCSYSGAFKFFLCEKLLLLCVLLLPPCAASLQGSVAEAGLAVAPRPQENAHLLPLSWRDGFGLLKNKHTHTNSGSETRGAPLERP